MEKTTNQTIKDVYLKVWGKHLDPMTITAALKVNPSKSHCLGDEKISSTGRKQVMKSGYWEVNSKDLTDSISLEEQINSLITLIMSSNSKLNILDGFQGAEINLIIGVDENSETVEFKLDSSTLQKLSNLNLEINFVII